MALHQTGPGSALLFLVGIALLVVGFYLFYRWVHRSLGSLGLSHGEVALILWATLVGSFVNVPLLPFGEGSIGINIGGGVVPVLLSLYLMRKNHIPFTEVLVGVVLVATVSYLVTDYEPGVGVIARFPWWLLPAVTAFFVSGFAYWHDRADAASLAYVSGTLGTLIGADLFRLPEILSGPAPGPGAILSIGGGAVFDMVYLTGILAITLETGLLAKRRHDLSRAGRENPIEAEYQDWLRRKEREWADARREEDAQRRAVRPPARAPPKTVQRR